MSRSGCHKVRQSICFGLRDHRQVSRHPGKRKIETSRAVRIKTFATYYYGAATSSSDARSVPA
jgi:hypothetical protein